MDAYILGQYIDRCFTGKHNIFHYNIFESLHNFDRIILDTHIVINYIFLSDFAQVYRTKK